MKIEQLNKIKCINGDCMDWMKQIPDNHYDLAIVDPPYGINANNHQGSKDNGWRQWRETNWDQCIPKKEYFNELFRVSRNQIIWGGNYMVSHLKPSMGWIVWDKGQRNFSLADGELAFSSLDRALRIFTHNRAKQLSENRIHPTQKPVQLYKWLLDKYAKQGDRILDTHGGSMSHAIACHDLGYELTIIEKDEDYFNQAIKRLKWHQRQGVLFDSKEMY